MSLGNTSLHQRGEIPEIIKLPNGRIRVVRRFHKFTREDIDNATLGSTMGNFGDLDTTGEQVSNQGYTDCRLIKVEVDTRFNAISNADNAVLVKTYETLTSSFVQITDDTIRFTDNGLKEVTRTYRAVSGTTSSNVVGTTSITSGSTTLYLASSKVEDNDAFAELTEVYFEAGTLSQSKTTISEGVMRVVTTFLHTEGTTVGPVIARSIGEFEGLRTFSVTTLQDADGNSIVDGGTNLVHQYKSFKPFQYTGVISVTANTGQTSGGNRFVNITEDIERPPAQAQVLATTYVFFQTASDLVQADYTYDSSAGFWSPNNWASSNISISASGLSGFKISKGYRGYRTSSSNASGFVAQNVLAFPFAQYNNSTKIGGFNTSISYAVSLEKGPPNPIGSKWVISADIKPAFDDVSGTTYYKKTLVVTDTIPTQSANAEVPYD